MIQRIQTFFLMVAVVFLTFMIWIPFAEIVGATEDDVYVLGFNGLTKASAGDEVLFSATPLAILMLACTFIAFTTIFLYRKRVLQIRLSIFNIVLLLGMEGIMYYYYRAALKAVSGSGALGISFVFPFVAAILTFLALRAIARDEALVRSLDRLR